MSTFTIDTSTSRATPSPVPGKRTTAPSIRARKVSDRVVFMHAGRIHEIGAPEELFGAPKTAELKQFLSMVG